MFNFLFKMYKNGANIPFFCQKKHPLLFFCEISFGYNFLLRSLVFFKKIMYLCHNYFMVNYECK